MTPILEVKGLTVQFGAVRAVDDVTFDLASGEILGVIGPNGAGKTTMFDAISGFVPSRGHVSLGGTEISGKSPERRSRAGLGRSFQDARLFPSLTVQEALSIALERHIGIQDVVSTALRLPWVMGSEKRIKAKVDELIELMGLGAFRDKFVSELSTGSRRIVDLAAIMAHEPSVLLLDEPSSGIAQKETEALGPLLLRLREETGASLIVVEHDMPLIQSISDQLLALETGAVLTRGTPEAVLADDRLVAAYLGTDQATISRSGAIAPAQLVVDLTVEEATRQPATPAKRSARKRSAPVARKAAPAKKATAKKAATAKTAASKVSSAKKATAKKATTAKKASAAKKATAKKATAKKATATGKKAPAKKTTARATR